LPSRGAGLKWSLIDHGVVESDEHISRSLFLAVSKYNPQGEKAQIAKCCVNIMHAFSDLRLSDVNLTARIHTAGGLPVEFEGWSRSLLV